MNSSALVVIGIVLCGIWLDLSDIIDILKGKENKE